jgi:hypothetical protein
VVSTADPYGRNLGFLDRLSRSSIVLIVYCEVYSGYPILIHKAIPVTGRGDL